MLPTAACPLRVPIDMSHGEEDAIVLVAATRAIRGHGHGRRTREPARTRCPGRTARNIPTATPTFVRRTH